MEFSDQLLSIVEDMWDPVGHFLRFLPEFRGRGRLFRFWQKRRRQGEVRQTHLPHGGTFLCDLSDPYEAAIWLGYEEKEELALLGSMLRAEQNFIDCGANVGLWSICAGHLVGPAGRVWAFEPNELVRQRFQEAVVQNQLAKIVEARSEALSDKAGFVSFYRSAISTTSRIVDREGEGTIRCPATTLDIVCGGWPVHGLKLDVEGHELQVLQGAARIMRAARPWLIVEFNASLIGSSVLEKWPVHQYLRTFGYEVFPCKRAKSLALPDLFDVRPLMKRGSVYCNLLYKPVDVSA